jgi:peptide deformylase
MEAVGAEVFLYDQMTRAGGGELAEPAFEQRMQDSLADADRRVRPHSVDDEIFRDIFWSGDHDVAKRSGVSDAQLTGPAVHVDGVDRCPGIADGECVGDRSIATADVDEHPIVRDSDRSVEQKQLRAAVDIVGAEDPAIGDEGGLVVWKHEVDTPLIGRGRWLGVKILSHRRRTLALSRMSAPYDVRLIGDPVLRKVAADVTDIDSKLASLADEMLETMYAEPGIGLAAPQVGVQKRFFVYDIGEGPETLVNPVVVESSGEWYYEEGCLSVPGLSWDIARPKEIHITGYDLQGNEVSLEADELLSRLFQHELDHLDGVLLIDHLDEKTRKKALKTLRERLLDTGTVKTSKIDDDLADLSGANPASAGGLVLP